MGKDDRRVFVYDSLDVPADWLAAWDLELTHGVPLQATGRARPKMLPETLVAAAAGHQALLGASGAAITAGVIEQLPDLRYVAKLGIGWEVIDVAAATAKGIVVTNTPIHSEIELVAEHAIGLMLACVKQFSWYNTDYVVSGGWRNADHLVGTLTGATVGIVGYGNIGRAVGRRLANWDVELLVYDVRPIEPGAATAVDLETLLRRSDLITLHLPAPAGGQPMLTREHLEQLKPGAILVNTARGAAVDNVVLAELLRSGHVAGVGVDVYQPEPPSADHPLLSAPNVFATPHVAAWNAGIRKEMVELALASLCDLFDGKVPPHVVNPEVLEEGER